MEREILETDVLIIGGGTAGCYAAYTLAKKSDVQVIIAEKANIRRSGCLAAGVNAINCYITKGHDPQFYVDYAMKDAHGIAREDLLLSMCERVNQTVKELEDHGLVILKDENGDYVTRGNRNIKINGENIKPILASMVKDPHIKVINHVNITNYLMEDGAVKGAYGFDVNEKKAYVIKAKATLIATGGASGLYRPNNPGFSRHKMWYPPFNTGAGYAMGILNGAEMTTFEMRFIALRCKDTIAPTGTIAQGVGAKQLNSKGEIYETKYGLTTSQRLYGTVNETLEGRGPCYLGTKGISSEAEEDLYKAYLNMAPSQTLKWLEAGIGPSKRNVEIQGTEPYIVGGHTASGYWIDHKRRTTLTGLYAAGDVAGGAPQKYVTGGLAEGEIAAETILQDLSSLSLPLHVSFDDQEYEHFFTNQEALFSVDDLEETMQKIMDQYAGGIGSYYQYNEASLTLAKAHIQELIPLSDQLVAKNTDDLLRIYELKERLVVCLSVIAHLAARKETRWHSFAENKDYPDVSHDYNVFINSVYRDGDITIIKRKLGGSYEH